MAVPGNKGMYSQLISRDYKKIYFNEYMRGPRIYEKITKAMRADGHYFNFGQMYPLGSMPEKSEGSSIPYQTPEQGNEKTVYFPTYALGVMLTREAYDDDQSGNLKKMIGELGRAGRLTRELKTAAVYADAFTGSSFTGLDGSSLIASDHAIGTTGDSFDNSVSGALAKSTLETGITKFRRLVDHANAPIVIEPNVLMVPPELEWKAKELLSSAMNPETANNADNTVDDVGLSYLVNPYLSSTSAWFLMNNRYMDLHMFNRRAATFQSNDDFDTESLKYRGIQRFNVDFGEWQWIVGSSGA